MEERAKASINAGTNKVCTTVADVKLRVAEHILAQYDCYDATDIRHILNETKAGAWRRSTLHKMLKMVFSAS